MKTISRLVSLVMVICLTQIAFTQHKLLNDLKREGILGELHTVKTVKIPVSPAGVELKSYQPTSWQITIYNRVGNKAEEQYFNDLGVLIEKKIFSYSASGKLTEVIAYNTDGLVIDKIRYIFNLKKNEIEEVHLDGKDKFMYKNIRAYNQQGKPIKFTQYDGQGVITSETIISYDATGKLIASENHTFPDGVRTTDKITYIYNNHLSQTEVNFFDSAGIRTNKIVAFKNRDGADIRIKEYNAKDDLVNVRLIVHTLDLMGNWITEKTFLENPQNGSAKLIEVTNRAITYY